MKRICPLILALALAVRATAATNLSLMDFNTPFKAGSVPTQDATIAQVPGGALRIATGHREPWPGITLVAPGGTWDLSAHAAVDLHLSNSSPGSVTVYCRVDNAGADGVKHCVTGSLTLAAHRAGTLTVPLQRAGGDTLEGKLFGMRGYPAGPGGSGGIDPARITQLVVFVNHPTTNHTFELDSIAATGTYVPPTASVLDAAPFFPFIDTFGQYKHRDWPGKTKSLADLTARREAEAQQLEQLPGPQAWDRFGGAAAGPQLTASGFFRVEKRAGKWWLVDPDGHLFFSQGIDCVRAGGDFTPIEERADWFAEFSGDNPALASFFGNAYALHGHYQGRTVRCFSFGSANLRRKYGADWKKAFAGVAQQRLRSWGFNTIGNWSAPEICLQRRTPYTDSLGSHGVKMLAGSEGYWGKFPDVFDPGFAGALRQGMAGKTSTSANDPWCLGYFSDNEMSWGDDTSLALATLKSPATQAAKQIFVTELRNQYGKIGALNRAWGSTYASWDALLTNTVAPNSQRARADLTAFYTKTAETYFRTVRDVIKAVAPHQLYLGCRFAWVNDRAAQAAARYCDVVSYNLYRRSVADFTFPGGDKPLLIGEFHFGALDRGLFHTGLVPVASQADRAAAYQKYVLGALHHPQFVGTHWFQWQDEPTTGRAYDEENYQIGFVDIADTPYPEMVAASRQVAAEMYQRLPQ
ncbi:MAG TPA: beta-galactosidase [Verrucomicrobiae bacterium]|nr:beta-galactosidase [Verrucomicrobiae bacterium]